MAIALSARFRVEVPLYATPTDGRMVIAVLGTLGGIALAVLAQGTGFKPASSEKMLEIDFAGGKPVVAGDQFGKGKKR